MQLSEADIARVRSSSVPTLANAVETFEVREPNVGYTTQPLSCHFPDFAV